MDDSTQSEAPVIHEGRSVRGNADANGEAKKYQAGDEQSLMNDEGFNESDFQYLETQGVISGFSGKRAEPERDPTVLAGRASRKFSQRDRAVGPTEEKEFVGSHEVETEQ